MRQNTKNKLLKNILLLSKWLPSMMVDIGPWKSRENERPQFAFVTLLSSGVGGHPHGGHFKPLLNKRDKYIEEGGGIRAYIA